MSLIGESAAVIGTSEMYLAEKLTRRCQEVVYVFEQVQTQFNDLETNVKTNY